MLRGPVRLFLSLFLGSAVVIVVAIGIVSMLRRGDAEPGSSKTLLAERIETARQIREALARPIPPPEPLGPIKAKPARELAKAPDNRNTASVPKLSRSARDAMAQEIIRPEPKGRSDQTSHTYSHGPSGW